MGTIKLYIVEDEIIIANDLKNRLAGFGYEVVGIDGKGEKAIESIDELAIAGNQPDIVIMDITLAGKMDGIETAKILSEKHQCGIIFLTSMDKVEAFNKTFWIKPYAYVFKPVDIDQLKMSIELSAYQRNLELSQKKAIADLKNEVEQRKKAEKETEMRLQEKIKAEHKVNQLHRQKHQIEMDLINRELATSSIFISQKNKIIGLIRKDVNRYLRKGKSITEKRFCENTENHR